MVKGLKMRVDELERGLIRAALRKACGIKAQAAKELKISERVLRYKMRKHGLKIESKLSHSYRIIDLKKSTKNIMFVKDKACRSSFGTDKRVSGPVSS